MKISEIQKATDWATIEGWNPGPFDLDCYYKTDPNGFFVGMIDETIVSMISAVKYGKTYGFIGFYIVEPRFRGKGYGITIWNEAIEYLENRMVGLDGVPAQILNYEKSGFKLAHRNITFQGNARLNTTTSTKIIDLNINDIGIIKLYDRKCFPEDRDVFLRNWIAQTDSWTIGFVNNKILQGYAKIRKCGEVYKIGPLFADNYEIAEDLFIGLQQKIPVNSKYSIDIPETNLLALKVAEKYDMEYSFETARMYKNGIPNINMSNVFGITSYELG